MDFSFSYIFSNLMISCFGMAFFMYGKKAGRIYPLLAGVAMSIYPFFFSDWKLLWVITIVLLAVLYFVREQ